MEEDKNQKNPPKSDKEKELLKKNDSVNVTEKENLKDQIKKEENMEVHHVKHQENHRYSIKIFLYEFLIIFLAVTISFFVENIQQSYWKRKIGSCSQTDQFRRAVPNCSHHSRIRKQRSGYQSGCPVELHLFRPVIRILRWFIPQWLYTFIFTCCFCGWPGIVPGCRRMADPC